MRKTFAKKPLRPARKGGPLRSKKPGRNQIAQPRVRAGGRPPPPEGSAVNRAAAARRKTLRPKAPAAPSPAPVEAGPELPDPSRQRALDIARAGLDKKAEQVLLLDVRGLTSYADYFVLMTADSDRQAGAIADALDERLKEQGATKVGVEGYESGRWILVDYGDVVAHVFNREARGFYDLEGLWADAPRFQVEG